MDLPFRPEMAHGEAPRDSEGAHIWPLLVGYWSFGQYWGVWVLLVYEYQRSHDISDPQLGLLYMLLSSTAVVVMLLVAPRLQPLPLSITAPLSLAALGVGAVAIAYLPAEFSALGFALVGVGNGLIDVFLNVAGQRAEVATRKPVLQWLHASYALGGVTGAAMAGLVIYTGLGYRAGLAYAAAMLFITTVWNARTASREPGVAGAETTFSVSALKRSPVLWIPALVVLFAFLIEGSMDTWSGLYLRGELGASILAAALVFMGFGMAVFLGRLFAGKVLFGLGPRKTILWAGAGSMAGGMLAIVTHSPLVVGFAFLLLGFSLSAAAPAGFGLVEVSDEDPTNAIAAVTTVGYTGFIWSPPLLGWVAATFSLRATMAVIVLATVGLLATGFIAPHTPEG